MSKKMNAIRAAKLAKAVAKLSPKLKEEVSRRQENLGSVLDITKLNCVTLNYRAAQELQKAGFDAKFVAGKAAFGVNKGKFGVIDYGYSSNPLSGVGESEGFQGHAWVELKKVGVIVDLTLPDLKQVMLNSNGQRGIRDESFLLSNKPVVSMGETTSVGDLMDNFRIGYHYAKKQEMTEWAEYYASSLLDD